MRTRVVQLSVAIAAVVGVAVVGIPPASAANSTSSEFAGVFAETNVFKSATARVKVPDVTCAPGMDHSQFLSVVWFGTNLVGTGNVQLGINIDCDAGTEEFSATLTETDPTGSEYRFLPIAEGDVITVSMTYDSGTGVIKATGKNVTQKFITSVRGVTPGLEFNGAQYYLSNQDGAPIPAFKTIPFSNLKLNGNAAQSELTNTTVYDLINSGNGHTLVKASPFNAAGVFFQLIFKSDQ